MDNTPRMKEFRLEVIGDAVRPWPELPEVVTCWSDPPLQHGVLVKLVYLDPDGEDQDIVQQFFPHRFPGWANPEVAHHDSAFRRFVDDCVRCFMRETLGEKGFRHDFG